MSESVRLLVTGDLHLGRYPARVPAGEASLSVDRVWADIVQYAIDHRVDALILTGDIADEANRFYEALGALKRGLEKLIAAEIPTFAVAGNHDHDVLAPLADTLNSNHFRVLGRGGVWETTDFAPAGKTPVRLVGWSFPTRHFATSPLAKGFPTLADGPTTLALLHADLDVPGSTYAPVAAHELLVQPVDAWLLGHQHGWLNQHHAGRHILYPGSPQPLRQPEGGAHGPALVTVHPDSRITCEMIPLATIRYAPLAIDVSAAPDVMAMNSLVGLSADEELRRLAGEQPSLRHLAFRIELLGRTALHREIANQTREIEKLDISAGGITAGVERVVLKMRPVRDLLHYKDDPGPAGVLARLLIDLEESTGEDQPRVGEAAKFADDLLRSRAYLPLRQKGEAPPSPDAVRQVMIDQGLLLLDSLLAQTETRS